MANNVFTVPEARTVRELLVDYMEIYGVNKWAMSTYDAKNSLINNYINPIIGDIPLSDLNPRMMEKFYLDLLKVKSKVINNRKPEHEYLTSLLAENRIRMGKVEVCLSWK